MLSKIIRSKFFFPIALLIIIFCIYYKMFLFGKIPFPGDLLIGGYSPWFDYFKMPIKNPLLSDVFSQIFLWKYLGIEQIKNFQWPLWNPYSFTGNPLLANYQSAILYPINLLLFLPKYFGWGVFIFAQTAIAAFSMYALLSLWIPSRLARIGGSITFALGGLMTTWLELGTAVHAICWLPLALFSIEKYFLSSKFRYLLLLVISTSLILTAGFAQIALYSLIVVSVFILIKIENFKLQTFINVGSLFFSLCLSFLISAPQLLPTLDLLSQSIRSNDSYTQIARFGLLPIKETLKFFAGDYFGNSSTGNYWGGFLNYIETSSFLGTLNLPLLVFAIFFLKKNKIIKFFLGLLISSIILAFDNPISYFIYQSKIPLLTQSYASRILFITVFSVSILISFSINQIIKSENQYKHIVKSLTWSLATIIGIIIGTFIIYFSVDTILYMAPNDLIRQFYLKDNDFVLSNFIVSLRNLILPFTQIFLLTLVSILLLQSPIKKIKINSHLILSTFFVIFLILDLSRYFLKVNPFVNQKFIFPTTPSIEYLQKQAGIFRVGRENAEVLPPNTWTFYKLQSFEGYDPLYLKNYSRFIFFLNNEKLESTGYGRYAELSQKNYKSSFLDISNVKFFIALLRDKDGHPQRENINSPEDYLDYRLQEKVSGLKVVFHDKSSAILENPNFVPRVYFTKSLIYAPTPEDEERIFNSKFNPKESTMISENLNPANLTGKGEAKILSYTPNRVEIETKTESDEVLVFTDQFEQGWKAIIDNNQTKIVRANLVFRAVKIPKGNHTIIFYYWPKSFEIGLQLFVLSSITIFILGILYIRVKPKI